MQLLQADQSYVLVNAEYVPFVHLWQSGAFEAPSIEEYVPAMQILQSNTFDAPVNSEKVPTTQF